jgi:hypothetical protein
MTDEQIKLLREAIKFLKPQRKKGYWKPLEDLLEEAPSS